MNTPKEDNFVKTVKAMYELKEAKVPRPTPEVTKMLEKIHFMDADTYEDLLYRLAKRTREDSEEIEDPAFGKTADLLYKAWNAYAKRDGS